MCGRYCHRNNYVRTSRLGRLARDVAVVEDFLHRVGAKFHFPEAFQCCHLVDNVPLLRFHAVNTALQLQHAGFRLVVRLRSTRGQTTVRRDFEK